MRQQAFLVTTFLAWAFVPALAQITPCGSMRGDLFRDGRRRRDTVTSCLPGICGGGI